MRTPERPRISEPQTLPSWRSCGTDALPRAVSEVESSLLGRQQKAG